MAVNLASVAGVNSSSATTSTASSGGTGEIAGNFQQFLLLLTTQLKNQSPLDPLDTNQFTQQLVQFASVEQQLKTNSTLTSLVAASKASTASTAASLVGTSVTLDGSKTTFEGGAASWTLTADKAASATLTISDSTGAVIATQTKALAAGSQSVAWDGRTLNGDTVSTGTFKVSVTAKDASGATVKVGTDVTGVVSSVELSGDDPVVVVGGRRVSLSSLKSVGG
jgi:flagellar basal-body rod modification protein FlgD